MSQAGERDDVISERLAAGAGGVAHPRNRRLLAVTRLAVVAHAGWEDRRELRELIVRHRRQRGGVVVAVDGLQLALQHVAREQLDGHHARLGVVGRTDWAASTVPLLLGATGPAVV